MSHPYRTPTPGEPDGARSLSRLDVATVLFGVSCGILVEAVGGPGCALVVTLAGVVLLLRRVDARGGNG